MIMNDGQERRASQVEEEKKTERAHLRSVRNGAERIGRDSQPADAEARQRSLKLAHHEGAFFVCHIEMITRPVFGSAFVQIAHRDVTDIDRLLDREDLFDKPVRNKQRHRVWFPSQASRPKQASGLPESLQLQVEDEIQILKTAHPRR